MQTDLTSTRNSNNSIMNNPSVASFTDPPPPLDYFHFDLDFALNRLSLSDTFPSSTTTTTTTTTTAFARMMTSSNTSSSLTSPARMSSSRFVVMHQDLVNRHALLLTRLQMTADEVELLREENAALRSFNRHLTLSLTSSSTATSSSVLRDYSRRPEFYDQNASDEDEEDESPTSVIEAPVERVPLPKSISVRSNGYLKLNDASSSSSSSSNVQAGGSKTPSRVRTPSTSLSGAQKVYVPGVKKNEEPLELEVYNQGMFKTELCNKWQEMGACPYGDHCQFAHGIEELRPVIRHPRYKTEVCRMVLAGDICPYGHRCHFRHVLTEQESFMGRLNKTKAQIKLDR